jgi:hypothetical protein
MSLIGVVHHAKTARTTVARGLMSYPHHPSHPTPNTGEMFRLFGDKTDLEPSEL